MEEKILEGNKLIAKYMGYTYFGFNDPRLDDIKAIGRRFPPGWKRTADTQDMKKLNKDPQAFLVRNHTTLPYYNSIDQLLKVLVKLEKDEYTWRISPGECTIDDKIVGYRYYVSHLETKAAIFFSIVKLLKAKRENESEDRHTTDKE